MLTASLGGLYDSRFSSPLRAKLCLSLRVATIPNLQFAEWKWRWYRDLGLARVRMWFRCSPFPSSPSFADGTVAALSRKYANVSRRRRRNRRGESSSKRGDRAGVMRLLHSQVHMQIWSQIADQRPVVWFMVLSRGAPGGQKCVSEWKIRE